MPHLACPRPSRRRNTLTPAELPPQGAGADDAAPSTAAAAR